ncbi:MFS transporter [Nonomuraea jiangxiensis]|uniref:MFS-type transporter involved in bile tolerance, Atg22 family n=1 Tax=Nonomuraea jiangxiensis TaxID=633440 RepID=A0A1G9NCZ3_9ACTN|nr:MFS transporter [Nonomuraea jiangxiensis]SDL84352.1 MFS-type transporter involved in bile tolerance, Atg22 family [Nonomuraea jiangxiensis]
MIAPYLRLFAHPGVPYLLAVGLVVKIGTPVLSLALLLAAVERLGSYAPAGLVLTGHALALAVCAPLGGRLADRLGPRATLTAYLAAHALAYALLLLALQAHAPAMIGAAALAGATTPPAAAVIRSTWPHLVPAASLPTAYAVDNAVNELTFLAGPLLVPVLTLVLPVQGVVIAAGAALPVGTALLLGSRAVRQATPASPPTTEPGSRLGRLAGPLAHHPTLVLLVIAALGTFSFGCLRIGTVAAAATSGSAASAGVLMGLLSAGALAGTLAYGARAWPVTGRRLLVLLSLAEAVVLLGGGLVPGFAALAVLIVVAGLVTGPRDALQPVLLADHAPARYRTEVFAWLNTFMWTGYGVGTAVAGRLTGPHDSGAAAFAAAAAAALAGAILTAVAYRPTPGGGSGGPARRRLPRLRRLRPAQEKTEMRVRWCLGVSISSIIATARSA